MHVAAPDSGSVDAAGVQAGRFQRDRRAVGAVQTVGFCAYEFAAKAQNSSAAKIERFLILEVLAGSIRVP